MPNHWLFSLLFVLVAGMYYALFQTFSNNNFLAVITTSGDPNVVQNGNYEFCYWGYVFFMYFIFFLFVSYFPPGMEMMQP